MHKKKKILLIWWYDRQDLFQPFLNLEDHFDYTLLFYKFKTDEPKALPYETVYWTDFNSPYALIKKVKPDYVYFMGIDSNYPIALNIACKNLGIKTFFIEHGVKGSLKYILDTENKYSPLVNTPSIKTIQQQKKWHSLLYILRSIRVKNFFDVFSIIKFNLIFLRSNTNFKLSKTIFNSRKADNYICFTKPESKYLIDRDGIDESQIKIIGNPSFDTFFNPLKNISNENLTDTYYLLIDTPIWNSSEFLDFSLGAKDRTKFYELLSSFSKEKGKKLYIKLHPDDYNSNDLISNENIVYVRESANIVELIKKADGCFGFFSTLILPAIYFKPTILFKIGNSEFQDSILKIGVVNTFDFHKLNSSTIAFKENVTPEQLKVYEEEFLYKADGKAFERLKDILLNA